MKMIDKIKVMPRFFMVKINKEQQKAYKEKINGITYPFFISIGSIHNSRNMEHGEITQIGDGVKNIYGWEGCKVGHTLIFHYSIESPQEKMGIRYFLYEDETFNYYVVDEQNVRGFYDGVTVVPHPNFVFLKNVPAFPNGDEIDEVTKNKIRKTKGGIFLVTNWNDSPNDIAQKSQKIKERIESLTKSTRTDQIQRELERLEEERNQLNRKSQKKEFLPYKVAFSNKQLDREFGTKITEDRILFCFNKAALYISNFQLHDYKYIVCLSEHIGGLLEEPWDKMQEVLNREEKKKVFNSMFKHVKFEKNVSTRASNKN